MIERRVGVDAVQAVEESDLASEPIGTLLSPRTVTSEPEPLSPMLMRAVYPLGISRRDWRRILVYSLLAMLAMAFLVRVQAILPPFLIAFFIAALLDPTVQYLERHGRSRVQSVLTLYLLGFLVLVLLTVIVVPRATRQIEELTSNASSYYTFVQHGVDRWMAKNMKALSFLGIRQKNFNALVNQRSGPIQERITEAINSLTGFLQGMASQAIWLIVIPVATFFFMRDYPLIRARAIALFPSAMQPEVDKVSRGIGDVFSCYIQGLAKICSLYGIAVFILLTATGQRYALFLGLLAGAFYVVPMIGPWIVAVFAGILSYSEDHRALLFFTVQSNSLPFAVLVAASVVVVQMVFDQLIYPRLVGGSVGLHPLVSIFALLAGATLFGILGMVIAVPVAGSIQILLTHFFPRIARPRTSAAIDRET